jgi:hypothetical protein
MTIALQAHSVVEKTEAVQVCFTLHLRDQRSKWMQDGCKVYMDSCMTSNESCFIITWIIFRKPPPGGRPNSKPGDHSTSKSHNHWFLILYCVCEDPMWIEIQWNDIWLKTQSHMASHYTWGPVTTLHDFGSLSGQPLDTSFGLPQILGYSS